MTNNQTINCVSLDDLNLSYSPTGEVEAWILDGNCLEGAGLPDGSIVLIDTGVTNPHAGDITICTIGNGETTLNKMWFYYGMPYVTTAYTDKTK